MPLKPIKIKYRIEGPWPEAEKAIANGPGWSQYYNLYKK